MAAAPHVGLPVRVFQVLIQAWARRLERRIERAMRRLDRAGLLGRTSRRD